MAALWVKCIQLFVFCIAIDSIACARKPTDVLSDVCSTAFSEGAHGTREGYSKRVRDPSKHISTRLVRYFWFGGVLQAISEETGIARDKLVTGGASQFQDQSSGRGRGIHAAHVIRVGTINSQLKSKSDSLNRALQNFIGHTQNVLREANVWHGVGGDIDRYQSDKLTALADVDFTGPLEPTNRRKVEDLITPFREIIDKYVQSGDAQAKTVLEEDKVTVYCVGPMMLFEEGKAGYDMVKNGDFVKHYDRA
uniref:Uncharacterized protein n=1 Tax=Anopheles farauti TaxID=69004 RepID=A0A182Q278_9DIPT